MSDKPQNGSMTPAEVVQEIERVVEQYPHGENVGQLRKLEPLLNRISKLTDYTDEMISKVQDAAERFYGGTDLKPEQYGGQYRHELLAAVHRLKEAMDMMRDQFPPGLNPKG